MVWYGMAWHGCFHCTWGGFSGFEKKKKGGGRGGGGGDWDRSTERRATSYDMYMYIHNFLKKLYS